MGRGEKMERLLFADKDNQKQIAHRLPWQ